MPPKFDKMREAIERSLKGQYPNWTSKQINDRSYAIAVSRWKKKYGKSPFSENQDRLNKLLLKFDLL